MPRPALFIGVVSHPATRFPVNQGPDGLAAQLARHIETLGLACEVSVNMENLWTAGIGAGTLTAPWALELDRKAVQRSLSAQLGLEGRWDDYLGRAWAPRRQLRRLMLRLGRIRRRFSPPPPTSLRRLLNIELSHLDLLERGLASGAAWTLVLEDDAFAADVSDLAEGLAGLLDDATGIAYVNLSHSFSHMGLGIEHLLSATRLFTWQGSVPRAVVLAERPVTNTVCAILYSRAFAQSLLSAWQDVPVDPIVPVDWKLNEVVMKLHAQGAIGTIQTRLGACAIIEPPPIAQGSMWAEVRT